MKPSKIVFACVLLILFLSSQISILTAQNPKDKKTDKIPKNKPEYFKDSKIIKFRSREIKIEPANETKINFQSGKKHVYLKLKDYPSKSKLKLLKKYNINLDNFVDDKAYVG